MSSKSCNLTEILSDGDFELLELKWTIPDFFPLTIANCNFCCLSPRFSYFGCQFQVQLDSVKPVDFVSDPNEELGCNWKEELMRKGKEQCGSKIIQLRLINVKTGPQSVFIRLRAETSDGIELSRFLENKWKCVEGLSMKGPAFWPTDEARAFEALPSRALVITCGMLVNIPRSVNSLRQMTELSGFSSNFKDLFTSKKGCDVTLKVKEREFQAHRAVLTARSPVFAFLCEKYHSDILEIPDCDPDAFEDFLQYLYTGRTEHSTLRKAHQLLHIAKMYKVKQLERVCQWYMSQGLQ